MADNRFKVMAVGTFKESAVDCPVQLKKYQIVYDVIADKTYLRAVLESFSDKKIVRVFLNIDCADIFEQKFAEVEKAAVNVECDKKYSEFGKECPIIIPKGTKTVKAYISRVVFSDMTVWENQDLTFVAPVSDLKPYTAIKERIQLEKELAKRNYVAKYLPVRYEKSWRCTCGHLNGNLNDVCSACRSRASILFNIFDDKNLEICKKEDTYNEARKFDTSKDYLQASKLYSTILDYKDSKVLFAKALENSQEAIYTSALDTLKTAQKEENFDSAIKSLSSISEYKDAKTQIEKAKEQKNEFIYNQALQRVKKDNVGKNDFDKSISDMQRIPSYKDSPEKIKEIETQKRAFLDKKEHARKMKKVRNISIVACVITAIVIAILIPYFVEPNLYTKETTYEEITIGDQSGYCLERYNENEDKVVIPSEYLGKPVLKIGERAFQGKSIKEITIPESVRQIGYDAFAKCKNLNAVYYTDVEKWCQISFGNSNANPLNYAHNLYLNGELLTDLTIPEGVAVDQYAFVGCNTLQNITADSVVASTIAKNCQSPSFNVIITNGNKIDVDAFRDCKGLKNITLPADVKSIGYEAFRNCSGLTSITIPDSVTKIGGAAFYGCNGLTSITIPDSVTSIGNHAFEGCSGLTSVTIPDSVTSIDDYAFCGCSSLMDITIPDSVTKIGEFAFYGCSNLTSMTLPFVGASKTASDGYDQVFGYIFGYDTRYYSSDYVPGATYQYYGNSKDYYYYIPASIKSVTITGGEIPYHAFYNCSELTSITIPDGVTSIGDSAFSGCTGLTSVTIPDSVTSIGDRALYNCTGLTSIVIPDSVTSIGSYAFYGCSSIESITIPFVGASSTASNGYDQVFGYIFGYESVTSRYSTISGATCQYSSDNTYYWYYISSSLKSVVISDGATSIPNNAFSGCTGLTSIVIPDSVTSIGSSAFSYCNKLQDIYITDVAAWCNISGLDNLMSYGTSNKNLYLNNELVTSITIPNGVTAISSEAFKGCSSLTSITIPDSVTSIGDGAFYGCSGLTSITIPDNVTSIGNSAFYGCTGLASITIPDSVTSIGIYAFKDCSSLTSIAIPDGVQTIDKYTFFECTNLANVTIGNNVTNIGDYAFSNCSSLTSIIIPDSVMSIGYGVFSGCSSLESITIPFVGAKVGVTSSDTYQYPFGYIFGTSSYTGSVATVQYYYGSSTSSTTYDTYYIPSSLKSVIVTSGNILYGAFYDCSGLTSISIPDNITSIGLSAFYSCSGLTDIAIPNSVTSIGGYAFYDCSSLTSIAIPDGVQTIDKYTFFGCTNLANVTIGNNVTNIDDYAFSNCSSLTSITIPDSVTSIGNKAFRNCTSLTSITIPDSVTSIGYQAFCNCTGLTSITIPDSVTSIVSDAFYNTAWYNNQPDGLVYAGKVAYKYKGTMPSNTLIAIKEGTISISSYAFSYCSGLIAVTIPDSVISIGSSAFSGCSSLESITIPFVGAKAGVTSSDTYQYPFGYIFGTSSYTGGVATMQNYYGSSTSLTSSSTYYIPSSLKSVTVTGGNILYGAFYNCRGLTSVTIPDSVTSIGDSAFSSCNALTRIIGSSYATSVIAKQCGASTFEVIITIGTSIDDSAFYDCTGLASVTIPNSVTNIGDYAFRGCSGLTSVTIPDSVANIGKAAFSGCSGLTSITIPDSVANIGKAAFSGCSSLTSITIPDSVTSIGEDAFYRCTNLTSMTLPFVGASKTASNGYDQVFGYIFGYTRLDTSYYYHIPSSMKSVIITGGNIPSYAFRNCSGLTSITISNNVTSIGERAFYNCSGLKSVTIGNGVTSIGVEAFRECSGLKSVTIGNGVTSIGGYTFEGCTGLTSVTIGNGVTSIGGFAFWDCNELTSVFYAGTAEQWAAISIDSFNGCLTGATRIYNYDGVERTYSFVTNCDESVDPITAKHLSSLPILTRDGYHFCGWYANESFEEKAVSAPYYSKDKTTLYAKWLTEEEWLASLAGTSFEKAFIAESGQTYDVSITKGGQIVYFVFTPTTSGSFTIQSTGSGDTYGTLYSSSKSSLKTSDDDGDGNNFKITYTMTAGTTYYVAVKFYGSSTTGTFKVSFS